MVIERFKQPGPAPVDERFRQKGRALPEVVAYDASWANSLRTRRFQLIEAPSPVVLDAGTRRWMDLIDLEVVPVVSSAEFWASQDSRQAHPS